jgi:2-polyprenyl-3-methyl-5-hydroxy-6-metoxy-1,4-benzoquinol methylase
MARKAGYIMKVYDKFYADDRDILNLTYNFITCTEVAEHLADPAKELGRLWHQLESGGLLVIQTKRVLNDERFKTWFYRDYPTHITFFAQASFEWLAEQWRAVVYFPHDDVAVFVKKAGPT